MTRRDSEVGLNDAEGDRGGCSSRPPASSSSSSSFPNDEAWREKEASKTSGVAGEESKLSPGRQRLVIGNSGVGNTGDDESKKEDEKCRRVSEQRCIGSDISAVVKASEASRQPFRRKMEFCLGQGIETTDASGSATSITVATSLPNNTVYSSTSGSSTPVGETRITTSILFDLPKSCGTSADSSMSKMPAITKAQMKEFEDAFNLFDKDRDGSITKEELGRVMRGLGQFARTEELRTMLEEIDTDGDGNVSLVEFVKIVSNIGSASAAAPTDLSQEEQEEQELRDAFRFCKKEKCVKGVVPIQKGDPTSYSCFKRAQ